MTALLKHCYVSSASTQDQAPKELLLFGIGFASLYYADVVIGELCMAARQLDLRHVATCAVCLGNGTRLHFGCSRCSFTFSVTGKTFPVVRSTVVIHRLMRVVARKTTDARIISYKALAVLKTIRLEADKCWAMP